MSPGPAPVPEVPSAEASEPSEDVTAYQATEIAVELPHFLPFEQRSTYFVIEASGGTARCVRYEVDPGAGELRTRGLSVGFEITEAGLATSCTNDTAPLAVVSEGVSVGAAIWFVDPIACERAIRAHRRVAMNFQCSRPPVVSSLADQKVGASRLLAVAGRGGSLYSIEAQTCRRISVVPTRRSQSSLLVGELRWSVTRALDRTRGTVAVAYELSHVPIDELLEGTRENDAMVLSSPVTTWRDGQREEHQTCVQLAFLELHRDRVVANDTLYFTPTACRAELARRAARASWFPSGQGPADTDTAVFRISDC
jgi:hypothetical protein